jgi:hypothetical protein
MPTPHGPEGRELQATMSPTTKGTEACVDLSCGMVAVRERTRTEEDQKGGGRARVFFCPSASINDAGTSAGCFAYPDRKVNEGGVRGADGEGCLYMDRWVGGPIH